jgi:hypothetical protein
MKRCPKCNQEFTEDWLTFCTSDGTPLTEAGSTGDPPPTMAMPRPPVTATQEERPTIRMPAEGVHGGPLGRPQQPQPIAPVWQPPPAPFAMAPQPTRQATNALGLPILALVIGIISMIFGLWCCFGVLTSPVAIGLGIFSLVQIKNKPTEHTGKPFAIIGIVTGALGVLEWILYIGLVLWARS